MNKVNKMKKNEEKKGVIYCIFSFAGAGALAHNCIHEHEPVTVTVTSDEPVQSCSVSYPRLHASGSIAVNEKVVEGGLLHTLLSWNIVGICDRAHVGQLCAIGIIVRELSEANSLPAWVAACPQAISCFGRRCVHCKACA